MDSAPSERPKTDFWALVTVPGRLGSAPESGGEARAGQSTAQARAPRPTRGRLRHVAARDWPSRANHVMTGRAAPRGAFRLADNDPEDPAQSAAHGPQRGPRGPRGPLPLAGASRRVCTGRTEHRRLDTWQHRGDPGAGRERADVRCVSRHWRVRIRAPECSLGPNWFSLGFFSYK